MFSELFCEHLRAAQPVLELFFEDFTGAQRVLEAVFRSPQGGTACFGNCFSNTLGRHSVFWELFFAFLRAAQLVLGFVCENFRAAQRVLDDFLTVLGSVPPWGLEEPCGGARGY